MRLCVFALGILLATAAKAPASETITYTYDARGRLVQVSRSGSVNNGVATAYSYDKADNRTTVATTTGGGGGGSPPSFAISDASVTEGGNLGFTVTKTGSTSSSFSVDYATASGTATSGTDFTAASGTLTFTSAETSKPVTVTTTQDSTVEADETLLVNLTNATGGATITDAQGVGTILNDDSAAPPSFAVSDASEVEGGTVVFTVTRSGSTAASNDVSFATSNGSGNHDAKAGIDYVATSGILTFAIGETSKQVGVTTIADPTPEFDEPFFLNLSNATGGATITDAQGLGTILNDDETEPCPNC